MEEEKESPFKIIKDRIKKDLIDNILKPYPWININSKDNVVNDMISVAISPIFFSLTGAAVMALGLIKMAIDILSVGYSGSIQDSGSNVLLGIGITILAAIAPPMLAVNVMCRSLVSVCPSLAVKVEDLESVEQDTIRTLSAAASRQSVQFVVDELRACLEELNPKIGGTGTHVLKINP
jgi:hypothetical protein